MEILGLDFQAFRRPSFPQALLGADETEAASGGDAERAMELVAEGIEKAETDRAVENLHAAFIQGPQSQPFVSEDLTDERAFTLPLQAALLRDPP